MDQLNFYLSAAAAYATQASTVFNMFLTVLFGSLGFAAALPLNNIGQRISIYKTTFTLSSSSILIGLTLLSFYVISFLVSHSLSEKANILLGSMLEAAPNEGISSHVVSSLSDTTPKVFGLPLPSFGFLIGSSLGLIAFMWLANVRRNK